jgi:hypothetical protein
MTTNERGNEMNTTAKITDRVIDRKHALTWRGLQRASVNGTVHDEDNPDFILSMIKTDLLRRIIAGEIDIKAVAKCELEARS